jgi:hypothetical protein
MKIFIIDSAIIKPDSPSLPTSNDVVIKFPKALVNAWNKRGADHAKIIEAYANGKYPPDAITLTLEDCCWNIEKLSE